MKYAHTGFAYHQILTARICLHCLHAWGWRSLFQSSAFWTLIKENLCGLCSKVQCQLRSAKLLLAASRGLRVFLLPLPCCLLQSHILPEGAPPIPPLFLLYLTGSPLRLHIFCTIITDQIQVVRLFENYLGAEAMCLSRRSQVQNCHTANNSSARFAHNNATFLFNN